MKDSSTRKYVLNLVGKEICNEIRLMASNKVDSFLCSTSKDDLKTFSWGRLHAELSTFAPVLHSILLAATKTRVPRPNTRMVTGMCAAILLKHRNPKMSLVQKVVSLVLYAGHASKQVKQLAACIQHVVLVTLTCECSFDAVPIMHTTGLPAPAKAQSDYVTSISCTSYRQSWRGL